MTARKKRPPIEGCAQGSAKGGNDAATERFLNALILEPRVKLDAAILTAADAGYFVPLQCLVASLRVSHDCRIIVVDLGLKARQLAWLKEHGCEVQTAGRLIVPRGRFFWQSWNKPVFIARQKSPTIWLDADCVVTGSLSPMDDLLHDRPAIYTDTAAVHFNGWREGTECAANHWALYLDYTVKQRFAPGDVPNAGVLGFSPQRPRDKAILTTWLWMVRRAMRDKSLPPPKSSRQQDNHGLIRWHDQGALQWALEKLGECDLVLADRRCNDPISAVGAKSLDELTKKIELLQQTRVVHFPSGSKPYHLFPSRFNPKTTGYPQNRRDLTLLVLGHDSRLSAIKGDCIQPVYLPDIEPDNDLAESRLFMGDTLNGIKTEYIGLCTQRWDEKYAGSCRPLNKLYELRQNISTVWAAAPADPCWLDYTEDSHPGMGYIIETIAKQMGVRDVRRWSVWSNNFIAHHSVVRGLQEWVWHGLGIARRNFGRRPKYGMDGSDATRYGSYLAERISMLYFCMRDDLTIKKIPL